ncbi:MAG: dienelactone hydrolase family protein [Rhodospirillaceae bacterium]|mgnify:CR=1 FL=1|jgi:carboxymethylenebutenolidase|nr:dienelactone hydrolase family protein [Rhodospirillaceae bacterium]MBT5239991.1 dienelactone hydrolase family protein [Rhodospirillaceae bacterium]MBT5564347.1 dienelactone hydrolase family protein [Rhodospirillaceae bacterium]MBT6090090.1 dienelactone hydrolase family protein [Rhodospirillaceae bacterium]MBT7451464.1 dienelactone hydrolase family protein [Rhodospirillaceae bacterium]
MGTTLTLTAADGHSFDAYLAEPDGMSKGGVVVVQEIFGVNDHMIDVTDEFVRHGYTAICPAFFDRVEPGVVLSYTDFGRGREIVGELADDAVVADLNAAADRVRPAGKVGVIGYCWGGAIAFLGACKANVNCGVSYYGTRLIQYSPQMTPKVPMQYHYGETDKSFPMDAVEKVMAEQPGGQHFVYPDADHGFSCDGRPQYNAEATKLALERSLKFFEETL